MANFELKIDTTEAEQKIKALNHKAEKLKASLLCTKKAADEATKAMQDFIDACNNINIDLES